MIITTASAYARPGSPGRRRCTWGRWVAKSRHTTGYHQISPCHSMSYSFHSSAFLSDLRLRLLRKPLAHRFSSPMMILHRNCDICWCFFAFLWRQGYSCFGEEMRCCVFLGPAVIPIKIRGELGFPKLHGEDSERHVCSKILRFSKWGIDREKLNHKVFTPFKMDGSVLNASSHSQCSYARWCGKTTKQCPRSRTPWEWRH